MMFMGDESIKRGESITDVVYRLLYICNNHPELKDEVYCQIMKQTTNNRSTKYGNRFYIHFSTFFRRDSWSRGWRLFVILTAYYDCSLALKPYLLAYLSENAEDMRRSFHGRPQSFIFKRSAFRNRSSLSPTPKTDIPTRWKEGFIGSKRS